LRRGPGHSRPEIEVGARPGKLGSPIIRNDFVPIAKQFDLGDTKENPGTRVLRRAPEKTGDKIDDSTDIAMIDPAKAVRALENAIWAANVLCCVEATMTEIPGS